MIPQETIHQIIQAANVVDVVGDFVSLKKRGANMIACCPFHNEKTPSFSVSSTKQIYKCFGCGKGGDSVRFLMDLEGLSYPEALKWLAKKYGIEIQEKEYTDEELLAQNERDSLFIVTEFAQKYYAELLKSDEGKSIGHSYFKERGYTEATIEKFGLGYSLDAWDSFTKEALKKGFTIPILEKAGLSIIKEGKDPIDRFRGRVIFPINNVAGKTIAFGARILKVNPKSPKYLNSPETDIYHKSRIVYGIFDAKTAIRQEDNCYLVEGYTDVVSLNQAGVENVVASSGTSLTKEQIQLIRRFSNNITVLYDGDAAGINASLRGTDLILEENMNVKVVVFPDGEDPDSYVQKVGSEAFKIYIKENQKDFVRFKAEVSLEKVGNDPIAKAGLITDLVETIIKIPDAIKRAVFYKEVANLLEIDEEVLINEGNKFIRKNIADSKKNRNKAIDNDLPPADFFNDFGVQGIGLEKGISNNDLYELEISPNEDLFMKDLVCCANVIVDIDENDSSEINYAKYAINEISNIKFESLLLHKIFQEFKNRFDGNLDLNTNFFTSHEDQEIQDKVIDWLSPKYELSPNWEKFEIHTVPYNNILADLGFKNVARIRKKRIKSEIESLTNSLDELEIKGLWDDVERVQLIIIKKKDVEMNLADILGSVI